MVRAAMTAVQGGRAGGQLQSVGWLRERVVVVEAECQALRAERDQLAGQSSGSPARPGGSRLVSGSWKPRSRSCGGRASARPRRSPRADSACIPGGRAASLGRPTGSRGGGRCPSGSTGWWRWDCRMPARTAVVRWSWSGSLASGRRTCLQPDRPRSAATRCRSAAARGVTVASSRVIPPRPRMPWARPRCSLAPCGGAGGLVQQGLGVVGRQGRPAVGPARPEGQRGWGDPGGRSCGPPGGADLPGAHRGGQGEPGGGAGRDRLAGRRVACVAVGVRRPGAGGVPHRRRPRVPRRRRGAGRGLRGGVGTRRLGALSQVHPCRPPELCCPPAAPGRRAGGRRQAWAGQDPACRPARPPAGPCGWCRPRCRRADSDPGGCGGGTTGRRGRQAGGRTDGLCAQPQAA
jgi:hypothetical protein